MLANRKATSFHTEGEKVEAEENITSCPSLACGSMILKLYLKMPTFNVEDLSCMPISISFLSPEHWMRGPRV